MSNRKKSGGGVRTADVGRHLNGASVLGLPTRRQALEGFRADSRLSDAAPISFRPSRNSPYGAWKAASTLSASSTAGAERSLRSVPGRYWFRAGRRGLLRHSSYRAITAGTYACVSG